MNKTRAGVKSRNVYCLSITLVYTYCLQTVVNVSPTLQLSCIANIAAECPPDHLQRRDIGLLNPFTADPVEALQFAILV